MIESWEMVVVGRRERSLFHCEEALHMCSTQTFTVEGKRNGVGQ